MKYKSQDNARIDEFLSVGHRLLDDGHYVEGMDYIMRARHLRESSSAVDLPKTNVMRDMLRLLGDLDIEFAVIGGLAVAVHGKPRNTGDIDVLSDSIPGQERISDHDYMRRFNFYRGQSHTGTHLILDHHNGMVELLLANTQLRRNALATSVVTDILGVDVPVVSPVMLIALKLAALVDNPEKRKSDLADIISVFVESTVDPNDVRAVINDERMLAILNKVAGLIE